MLGDRNLGVDSRIVTEHVAGRAAYNEHLSNLYKQHDISWFTPVELFQVSFFHFFSLNLQSALLEIIN